MRRVFALSVLLLVSLAACSGSTHKTTSPTTADGPNPDVIPAVITPAYVDAVFKVLNHIQGDATRALLSAGTVTPGVKTDIRAIYNDPLYSKEVQFVQEALGVSPANVKRPLGDVRTTVVRLISASDRCIFAQTNADYSSVLVDPGPPPASGYWMLRRKQSGIDPLRLNPTPWAFTFNAVYETATSIPDQCDAP